KPSQSARRNAARIVSRHSLLVPRNNPQQSETSCMLKVHATARARGFKRVALPVPPDRITLADARAMLTSAIADYWASPCQRSYTRACHAERIERNARERVADRRDNRALSMTAPLPT